MHRHSTEGHTCESNARTVAKVTAVTYFTPAHKESPQDPPRPPQPSILAKTKLGLAPSPVSPPCWRQACPTCPGLLGWGPGSQDQLPAQHRAGCPMPAPPPPLPPQQPLPPGPGPALVSGPCGGAGGLKEATRPHGKGPLSSELPCPGLTPSTNADPTVSRSFLV